MSRSQTPDLDEVERAAQASALRDRRLRLLEQRRGEVTRVLMSDKVGREFVSLLLDDCGWRTVPYSLNHAEVMRNEGRRSVGARLVALIDDHCQEQWSVMERERIDEERQWRTETEQEAFR